MEIVTNSNMIRKFRAIKEFTLDLGLSKTSEVKKEGTKGHGQVVIQIRDPFVKRYKMLTGMYIVKTGCIGSLDFYTDNNIGFNDFKIYDQDKEYSFTYKGSDNIRQCLSDILDDVLSGKIEPNNLDMNMNDKIEFKLDKNLPQNEFLDKQKEMEMEMSKMDIRLHKK